YKEYFTGQKGKLLHGDIGFDNIIVNNKNIAAVIDFEWSMSGDPAWDFAGYVDEYGKNRAMYEKLLQEYFKCLKEQGVKIDEENFRFRIKLYWVIKLLFIANTFKKDKNFNWAIQRFVKEINIVL
ncbi:phosphotransferase, partial [Candidatus Woesearchaeota archaeon]|nr:phosphotransferase [Candidatus Woesearchaeota archaeon]